MRRYDALYWFRNEKLPIPWGKFNLLCRAMLLRRQIDRVLRRAARA